jgi:hypothetical protein
MPKTYTPIATQTLTTSAASVTFSSIPSTYTDLVLVVNGALSSSNYPSLRFNGDTATNYSDTELYATTAAGSGRSSNQTKGYLGAMHTDQSTMIINIMNYANTTTFKTSIMRSAQGVTGTWAVCTLWRNTSAINTILIGNDGSTTFNIGTTFTLYGILKA